MLHKYPRTYHLPDSPGATDDDRVQHDLSQLTGELITTEKMDGGNLTFTREVMHGRSVDSGTHAWDQRAKALWARVSPQIPPGWRISGESMWARRSVPYEGLPGVYLVFGVWDATDTLLDWDSTVEWAALWELPLVPQLYRGPDLVTARAAWAARHSTDTSEGFVVRTTARIARPAFPFRCLKWVRAEHVRTAAGWRHRDDFAVNGLEISSPFG